ncbi:hypothetical protein ACFTXM_46050 [Streptomyces sp. NPDC056930]|uniref:hypothetical protein n=1 Tax=Streptomyces sp. NPDC056930 TaxID=3345967 RepID=UPI00363A88D8
MRLARVGAGAGEERGEGAGGFGLGGGEPGRERQLVDADAWGEVGGFGEQRGVRGQSMREPGVDVALHVPARAAREFVADRFVALARLGMLQRAQLAQRLELIGAGRDPGGFAQLGLPGGGRGVGGELGLDDVIGVRVVDGAWSRVGEQLLDALPLRELRAAAVVVGQVLVPRVLARVEPGVLEGPPRRRRRPR